MEGGHAQWRAFQNCIGVSQDIQAAPKMILQVRPQRTQIPSGSSTRSRYRIIGAFYKYRTERLAGHRVPET
jgi:hypothetical protein